MKILFIGDLSSYARARQRFLALQKLGHEVRGRTWVALETERIPGYRPPFWHLVRRKVGFPVDTVGINASLLADIDDFAPELLWIEKANTIWPSTYRRIQHTFPGLKMAYYSEDDIYLFDNRSVYLQQSLPLFDVVFTTKPRNLAELPRLGARRVECCYQAYDRAVHRPLSLSEAECEQWGAAVGFVGFFERDRAEQMLYLAKRGIQVRIWGFNWESWRQRHPNLIVEGTPVFNDDFIRVINATRINLNFLRQANRDRHTSRSLEIPACEGFMLAERTEEHLHLFVEGKEAEFFETPAELYRKVIYYLSHESERRQIAKAGRERCLRSGYSHEDRLRTMLQCLTSSTEPSPIPHRIPVPCPPKA